MKQETYLAVHSVVTNGRLRSEDAFESFVHQTARNVASNLTRRERRFTSLDDRESISPLASETPDPLALLISMERAETVLECLQRLNESDREILRLAYFEGLAPREIAERLQIEPSIARQRKSRALQRLKEVYRQGSDEPGFGNGSDSRRR